MDLEALCVDIGSLKVEGFVESQAQAVDGGEVDLIVQGCSGLEETSDFFNTKDGGKTVFGLGANER